MTVITMNRKELTRLQCEPDTDDFLAAGGAVLAEPLADRAQHEMPAQRPVSAGCNTAFSAPRGTFSIGLCRTQQEHDRPERGVPALSSSLRGEPATFEGGAAVTVYQITLRDRETRTVLGYYNGAWTTDRHRAIALPKREVAEDHAARMRDLCPRNAELINVEEMAAAD